MSIYDSIVTIIGQPPLGYEYLPYKTACALLVCFCSGFFVLLWQFQRSFQRGHK